MIFKKKRVFYGPIFKQIFIKETSFFQCTYCKTHFEENCRAVKKNICSICTTTKGCENLTALAIRKINNNFYVFSQHKTQDCKHIRNLIIDYSILDNTLKQLAFVEVLEYGHTFDTIYITGNKLLKIINNTKKLKYSMELLKPIIYVKQRHERIKDEEFLQETIEQLNNDFKDIREINIQDGTEKYALLHERFYKKSDYYPFLKILDELIELFNEYGNATPISLLNDVLLKAGIKNQESNYNYKNLL